MHHNEDTGDQETCRSSKGNNKANECAEIHIPCDYLNYRDDDEDRNEQECQDHTTAESLSSLFPLLVCSYANLYWGSLLARPIGWRWWSSPLCVL